MARRLCKGIKSRWRRQVIGRAYETAREVANVLPVEGRVLDVGCGHGFIAYHLTVMRGSNVVGLDLAKQADAPIEYLSYDGAKFPVSDGAFDSVLLSYVLHHTQDIGLVMKEVSRVLSKNGTVVVYEDIPKSWWDRFPLWAHDRKWRGRTGACTFRTEPEWRTVFESFGFEIVAENPLSRWNFLFHPVNHMQYVLKATGN
jgi:ubiquinone/menaquinone biosynthesis C-methylase UbiE